ncbi:MAPK-activated protein kinase Srk1 [Schizosaccharomyces pombe]|uniref:Serine/threonine-protein kinase srk1 n=1 Tax=Schizosaccharomyces pombe (strain 972 / ATCC 24843) TaxID=284812 RepID=SRK1_SCHPO|nr:MAPK-activated protein kinase Srk1 [Schizosaccharomyces pombe]O94547.1 RecName: Full=Serine/threonine-protein kinase srk1; AltName: Full=Sty1-regulated kinase 1 [Schizosaccharomyces pombe 972h-]CAA22861.1 MAPK-activated protein kinase Srk1 [Schizosaccharomyces pombe]|eukprot:NP_588136.1 MAPK-activated protein kinase Srk1 [Schizosaccharomyces pombe]
MRFKSIQQNIEDEGKVNVREVNPDSYAERDHGYTAGIFSDAEENFGITQQVADSTQNPTSKPKSRHAHFHETVHENPSEYSRSKCKQPTNEKEYDKAIEALVAKAIVEEHSGQQFPVYKGLEQYTLLQKMGDGAFSNVYKAIHNRTGEKVAIKVVQRAQPNTDPRDPRKRQGVESHNILKEVQIMRRVKHPNIIQLLEFIQTPEYYYLVLELADGGELFHQIVRLTYFSEDLSRHVITQVAHAIRYLHEDCGVVHRDIKPENLLFDSIDFVPSRVRKYRAGDDPDKVDEGEFIPGVGAGTIGRIRLADFGLSKVVWDSHTQTPCGTMGYTAPEIVRDERYSKGVDMWALGCVLYTILCGFPPFYDESISLLTKKVSRGEYSFLSPWWDDISKSAKDLISHLLTVDPESRYDIHQFLAHPWISGSREPTFPATDAPNTAQRENPFTYDFLEPEDVAAAGSAARTPGVNSLREVFNISYAAHRMEQEKIRKRGQRGNQGIMNFMGDMDDLMEENDDYDDGTKSVEHSMKRVNLSGENDPSLASRQPAQSQQQSSQRSRNKFKGFQLNLSKATLYNRRHRQKV